MVINAKDSELVIEIKKYIELDMMLSDGACVHSGNTGHSSVWAMCMHTVSAALGRALLCQILGYGALSLL